MFFPKRLTERWQSGLMRAIGVRVDVMSVSGVRIPPSPPVRYIPGTSLTLYSGHMVYTLAYLPQQGVPYAVEGDQCHGREDQVYRPSSM